MSTSKANASHLQCTLVFQTLTKMCEYIPLLDVNIRWWTNVFNKSNHIYLYRHIKTTRAGQQCQNAKLMWRRKTLPPEPTGSSVCLKCMGELRWAQWVKSKNPSSGHVQNLDELAFQGVQKFQSRSPKGKRQYKQANVVLERRHKHAQTELLAFVQVFRHLEKTKPNKVKQT